MPSTLLAQIARAKTNSRKDELYLSVYGDDRRKLLESMILSMPKQTYLLNREGRAAPSLRRSVEKRFGVFAGN